MWKWFLILWFAHWRTFLSQPVTSENTRETRQLNFDECCPCHNSGRTTEDHDVFGTTIEQAATADGCPYMSAADSEPASSIFTPALRAFEPFVRSAKEKHPKPLLKPEVGLASSVLETLREVTDQEYQEALARDAARNALRDVEQNLFEQETIDTPRNIVNIILQPKEGITDDAMPEASHVQETRCIHSPLGKSNSFKQKKFKSANKPLREYFPLSTTTWGNKYYDMDNSPSNMQEQVILPSKTNVLEDLKSKSNLLKMKLFSSSKNSLKDGYTDTDINVPNQFSTQAECDSFNNNRALRVPNFKLGSILDLLKASKQKNLPPLSPIMKDKEQENDFALSPSHLEKYYIRNNGRGFNTQNNVKPTLFQAREEPKSNQMFYAKEIDINDKNLENEKYSSLDQPEKKSVPFTRTNLKNDNKLLTQNDENNRDINHFNNKGLKNVINSNSNENMDAVPSPSELSIVEKSVGDIRARENNLNKECDISSDPDMNVNEDETKDTQKQTDIEETVPKTFDKAINNENNGMITKSVEVKDLKNKSDEESLCGVNDLETGSSSDSVQKANVPQENNKKLEYNVNNVLLERIDKDIELTTLSNPTDNINEESNTMQNDVSTQDLQEMSDRILNLSLSNEKVMEPIVLESKSIINKNTDIIEKTDNPIKTSELNNIEFSTISSSQTVEPTPTLSDYSFRNIDEIVDEVDKIADKTQDKDNIDITDYLSRKNLCENIATKNSEQTESSSFNDREREMMSEASSPNVNRIPHSNQNIMVQPNTNNNVKEFLNNFKSSMSDVFNNNRDRNRNAQNDIEYDNSNRNSIFRINNKKSNLNERPFNERNIDTIKSYSKGFTESDLFKPNRNNNLNSYKAKVATPESLDIRAIPSSLINGKEERLQKTFKNNPEITSASNVLRNSLEKPKFSRLKNFRDIAENDYDPRFNLQIPHVNSFSENLKSRTEETFRNIQDTINGLQQSQIGNQNKKLSESLTKPNMFRTLQPNDLSKRLQDFNSDIMDRLSQMSQRIQGGSQSKSKKNDLNNRLKTNTKLNSQLKDNFLLNSQQTSNLKPNVQKPKIISSGKNGISKQHLPQKSASSLNSMGANLRNTEYPSKFRNGFEPKTPLKKDIKRKPLRENKVTFSFTTTTRPELQKLGSKSKIMNKPTPAILRSSINLPKSTSLKSPLEKRIELMSKLKPVEPKPLASNRFTSRITSPDRKLDNSKITMSSSLEESTTTLFNDETANPKSAFSMENDRVEFAQNNVVLSKIRDAFKAKSNGNIDKTYTENNISTLKSSAMADATPLASNNINAALSNIRERPLKENVSYKCKMICYEDDSK